MTFWDSFHSASHQGSKEAAVATGQGGLVKLELAEDSGSVHGLLLLLECTIQQL